MKEIKDALMDREDCYSRMEKREISEEAKERNCRIR